ncbi:MAG: S-methyl-5'-thioadenosine phosphorylase [Chitinispirillales bacterium]|jgi:5'-methylthioadenosine phosphorylase|nr:S-methyl-5'-thioadenosine phosphorylase [Chitinispirillales bacterium]
MAVVGIIGGSGLDNPDILKNAKDEAISTPFGATSSPLKHGTINNTKVILIARHGREHTITPSNVNYRANIFALKRCGCTHILATTAVGSLKEEIERGDLVIIDQFIDFTKQRKITFHEKFEAGNPKHCPMSTPFNEELRNILIKKSRDLGFKFHPQGTVVTIEGPRFSTRAESNMFRSFGADIINMSIATEAILANETQIPYAAIAMSTDYDCWKIDEEPVSWEAISKIFAANADKVTTLLKSVIPIIQ